MTTAMSTIREATNCLAWPMCRERVKLDHGKCIDDLEMRAKLQTTSVTRARVRGSMLRQVTVTKLETCGRAFIRDTDIHCAVTTTPPPSRCHVNTSRSSIDH